MGALSAVTLWVLFTFPPEPRRSDAGTLGSQFEARKGEALGGVGPLKVTGASRQEFGRTGATAPSIATTGASSAAQSDDSAGAREHRSFFGYHSSSAAAEPRTTKETQTEPGAGADQPQLVLRTEPQDRGPGAPQQQIPTTLTDLRTRVQCNVNLCATTYVSFKAADCTYQPYDGGPRRFCELSTRPAEAAGRTPIAATDPTTEAKHTRVSEGAEEVSKSPTPARAGTQCNVNLCAATYVSFKAADCTYQPYGGGPRRICER